VVNCTTAVRLLKPYKVALDELDQDSSRMDHGGRGADRDGHAHYPAEPGDFEVYRCELPNDNLPDLKGETAQDSAFLALALFRRSDDLYFTVLDRAMETNGTEPITLPDIPGGLT
jgi:hypothetical protein